MTDLSFEGVPHEQIHRVLVRHGNAGEIARVLARIPADGYPLTGWADVERVLGGDFKANVNGRQRNLQELRSRIPPGYFPVESADDFADKATALDQAMARIPHAHPGARLHTPPGGVEPDRQALEAKLERLRAEEG